MSKEISFKEDARTRLANGAIKLADAVRHTMGPTGSNVAIDRKYGGTFVTNDGVTIAKHVDLSDNIENMGVQIVRQASMRTNDVVGDGTTTSIVLAAEMIKNGMKCINDGANPIVLRSQMEAAKSVMVSYLKKNAMKLDEDNYNDIERVATVSCQDKEMGKTIAQMFKQVGKHGAITVETGNVDGVETEVVSGVSMDEGYVHPFMVTNPERMEAVIENPYILIVDRTIDSIRDVIPVLQQLGESGVNELVIIADDVKGDALANFIANKQQGNFFALCIKADGYGDRKRDIMEDIAAAVGTKVFSESTGNPLSKATIQDLGRAKRVECRKNRTVIFGGSGDVDARVNAILDELKSAGTDFDKEKCERRLARISGGVGVIRIGGATDVELTERKMRIEDAIEATKAARDGVVYGGGVALREAAENCVEVSTNLMDVVFSAAVSINKQVSENTGMDITENAEVLDPLKVVVTALENATSVAGSLLTTQCAIAEEKLTEEKK